MPLGTAARAWSFSPGSPQKIAKPQRLNPESPIPLDYGIYTLNHNIKASYNLRDIFLI